MEPLYVDLQDKLVATSQCQSKDYLSSLHDVSRGTKVELNTNNVHAALRHVNIELPKPI